MTFGIAPTHPETGFGYIECGAAIAGDGPPAFAAVRFVEKPPLGEGARILAAGNYVWNSGMFCFTPARSSRRSRATRRPCSTRCARSAQALAAQAATLDAGDRRRAVRRRAGHLDRLRGDGKGGGGRRRRGRARHVRLERRRLVAGGGGTVRAPTRTATAARASASRSRRAARSSMPGTASSRRSASRTWSSSTRPTPCWSRIAITCSASRTSSAS